MVEDAGEKRAEWLEEKIPDTYMDEMFDEYRRLYATIIPDAAISTPDDIVDLKSRFHD